LVDYDRVWVPNNFQVAYCAFRFCLVRITVALAYSKDLFCSLTYTFCFLEEKDVWVFRFNAVVEDTLLRSSIEAPDVPSDDFRDLTVELVGEGAL
jgi:hypothetical protein